MRQGLVALVVALVAASSLIAANTVDYFNDVPYTWPATQGDADHILTNDGTGALSWAAPPSAEGLWSGAIVPSLTDCPAVGWTRVSAADDKLLVPWSSTGITGGAATHTHTLSGLTGGTVLSFSGNTASSALSIGGGTAVASISHNHTLNTSLSGTLLTGEGSNPRLISVYISSYNPSHSHGAGTLSPGSHSHSGTTLSSVQHSHAVGTLATDAESNYPAYLDVVLCKRD